MQLSTFVFTTLVGSILAASSMQGQAEGQAAVQPTEQVAEPLDPNETAEEKEKKKKKWKF